ncbi:MAG TPA: DUF4097 family beta strand repeat-containing protein [Lachnospiraceae bacterium]|nr:DUF4097 family beta strand repeat-containing protein [Lachnospiraceae bacterium]
MKKFMKVCGIIVGVILVIGIILLTIGGFNGGFRAIKSMVTNGELSIGSHELFKWDKDWVWNEDWDTYDLDERSVFSSAFGIIYDQAAYETSYNASDISKLKMELGGCKVVIEVSPDADYHVIANKISSFQTYVSDGTLFVRGLKTGKWVNWDVSTGMTVTVQIPQYTRFTSADLALGAGIFEIEDLSADDCEVEIGAGQISVGTLQVSTLKCQIGAGRMLIYDAETTGDTQLEVGAGELVFKGSIPGDLKAQCGMGNMQITVVDSTEDDHNYKMECMAGNLSAGSNTVIGLAVDHDIDNGSDSTYDLTCAMGNLEIEFE